MASIFASSVDTMPILVNSLKDFAEFSFTRYIYFFIEAKAPGYPMEPGLVPSACDHRNTILKYEHGNDFSCSAITGSGAQFFPHPVLARAAAAKCSRGRLLPGVVTPVIMAQHRLA